MFVRRTRTRATDGAVCHTHRLVRSERDGNRVRQRTLLNLGRHFDVERDLWPLPCQRVEAVLDGQGDLFGDVPEAVETEAQRSAAQLLARGAAPADDAGGDVEAVAVDSLALARPRSVGVEHAALWALGELGLPALLESLGVNAALRDAALGSVVARMAQPASERATMRWLRERSAAGELLGVDFETMGAMQPCRASDALMAHRAAIEEHLFDAAAGLFGIEPTVTLHDLANTCFEGAAATLPKAARGHSKEKRSDCPLLTLGLALDGSGFARRSEVFSGSVREQDTLESMLAALGAPAGALAAMDRGIATEGRVAWLREAGHRCLAVSRERRRAFDAAAATARVTRSGRTVHLQRAASRADGEVRLHCHSPERAEKENAILERFSKRFEEALGALSDGLARPRTVKRLDKVHERVGRLEARHGRVARHCDVEVVADDSGERAAAVNWTQRPAEASMATHPGVCCLRTNVADWDDAALWRHLHHPDRPRGRVPVAEVRTRPAAHPPPQAGPRRGTPVHHRRRLPGRAGHPAAARRRRRARQLDHAARRPRRPAARRRHLPTRRRTRAAPAHRHRRRTRPEGHPRRARHRPEPRRNPQNRRLNLLVPTPLSTCSAPTAPTRPQVIDPA